MSVAKQLYDLLGIDLEIEGHSRAIADVEIALSDNRLVLEAEKSVEDTRVLLIKQETKCIWLVHVIWRISIIFGVFFIYCSPITERLFHHSWVPYA